MRERVRNEKRMKKGKYKYLFGNMALFTVSNFVSKLLVMLLVPFYTNVLSTSEYGIADVMQATLLLAVPLLTINIGEAALRFGLEEGANRSNILRIGLKYVGASAGVVTLICIGITVLFPTVDGRQYALLFLGLFLCNSFYEFMILFCQGTEKVKVMIIGSVSCTILVILSNLYFLLVLRIGLYGYLYSQMISFAGAALIMFFGTGALRDMKVWKKDRVLEQEMTHYGKSMLLYSTSSWMNNAIDRYFVLGLCGSAVNGLYGVAYKIPAILTVFQRIFAQAWQMSATKNYKEEDSSQFFSTMYTMYQAVMVVGCSFLIFMVRIIAKFMFAKDFFEAWSLVPPLLISVIFGALTGFLGSICLAYKDGKSMGIATAAGAVVNIVLNGVGISMIGAMGAAIATMISYFVMYFIAYRKVSKYVKLHIGLKRDYLAYLILMIQAVCIMTEVSYFYVWNGIAFLVLFCMYAKEMVKIIRKGLKKGEE